MAGRGSALPGERGEAGTVTIGLSGALSEGTGAGRAVLPGLAAAGKVKLSLHGAWRGRAGPGLAGSDDSGWGGSAPGGGKGRLRGEVRARGWRLRDGSGGRGAGREAGVRPRALRCRAPGWWQVRIPSRREEAFPRGKARF